MASSIPEIAICIVALLALSGGLLVLEQRGQRTSLTRPLALALILVGLVAGGLVSWSVVFPPPAIAEGDVTPGQGSLDVVAPKGALEVLVHGVIGTGTGSYTVELKDGDKPVQSFSGTLERRLQTRKVTRRVKGSQVIEHLEGRHGLPMGLEGRTLHLVATKQQGAFEGPLTISVVPAPPSEVLLLALGFVITALGSVVDRRAKDPKKSHLGIGLAMYPAFAILLLESRHPLELKHLLAVVPMSALLGAAGGGLVRVVIGLFVKAPGGPNAPTSSATDGPAAAATSATA